LGVGNFSTGSNLVRENEKHGVISADSFTDGAIEMKALGAASPFVGEGLVPSFGVWAVKERVDVFSLACDGIVHFSGNGRIVGDQLDKVLANRAGIRDARAMGARIKSGGETGPRGFAKDSYNGGKRGRELVWFRNGHPRKWHRGKGHPRRWYWVRGNKYWHPRKKGGVDNQSGEFREWCRCYRER
jgi:hypothetical protein